MEIMQAADTQQFREWVASLPGNTRFTFRANRNAGTEDNSFFIKSGTIFRSNVAPPIRGLLTVFAPSREHDGAIRPVIEIISLA